MTDSVNRIVPPSVSVDPTVGPGRERERKKKDERARRGAAGPPPAESPENAADATPEPDGTKGKNININA